MKSELFKNGKENCCKIFVPYSEHLVAGRQHLGTQVGSSMTLSQRCLVSHYVKTQLFQKDRQDPVSKDQEGQLLKKDDVLAQAK